MGISSLFKSLAESASLRSALDNFNKTLLKTKVEAGEDVEKVIVAYTDKAASNLPSDYLKQNKALLEMVKNTKVARAELESVSPQESKFLSSFENVLGYRRGDVFITLFGVAEHLTRSLSDADNKNGPKTLMQAKALESLSQNYIKYFEQRRGFFTFGEWQEGIDAAFHAARSYREHGQTWDSERIYQFLHRLAEDKRNDLPVLDNLTSLKQELTKEEAVSGSLVTDVKGKPSSASVKGPAP
jgi:hypothetical protein